MRRPRKISAATRRKRNAARQRALRAERAKRKRCRTCGGRLAKSGRTGRQAKLCKRHLAADSRRKKNLRQVIALPWIFETPAVRVYPISRDLKPLLWHNDPRITP